jgi:anthranilate phosphoribosyltransferase
MREYLQKLAAGRDLTTAEAGAAMDSILGGEATPVQVGAFLTLLRQKGEASSEIVGCAQRIQERVAPIDVGARPESLVEMSGTGCDKPSMVGVSIGAALVAAASGVKVAKRVSRGQGGAVGTADVLRALGVNVEASLSTLQRCVQEVGIAFLSAEVHCAGLAFLETPRRELGLRTIFNVLQAVMSPVGARRQVVGVQGEKVVDTVATALKKIGVQHAIVIHGLDGVDEISAAGKSKVCEVRGDAVETSYLQPEIYGFKRSPPAAHPQSPEEGALLLNAAMSGQAGAARETIVLNAAAAIRVGGFASSYDKAVEVAKRSIASGRPKELLERLIKVTLQ